MFLGNHSLVHIVVLLQNKIGGTVDGKLPNNLKKNNPLRIGTCQYCNKNSVWVVHNMYFPDTGNTLSLNP